MRRPWCGWLVPLLVSATGGLADAPPEGAKSAPDGVGPHRPEPVQALVPMAGSPNVPQGLKLSLYVDNAVYEVGTMTRTNVTSPK